MITSLIQFPGERRRAAEFADLLDARRPEAGHEFEALVTLTGALRTAEISPRSEFSAALRAQLVRDVSQRTASPLIPSQRAAVEAGPATRRLRQAVAAAAAVALVGGVGAAAASTRALPGDSLYSLKRGLESVQLSLAGSDLSRGRELFEQADARLGEAERLAGTGGAVDSDTRVRIGEALADMDAVVRAGADVLTEVYQETGDPAALEMLGRFVGPQQQRLDALLDRLAAIDPGLRDEAEVTADLLSRLQADVIALTRTSGTVTTSLRAVGAARDTRTSGDGWGGGWIASYLEQSKALAGSTASSPSPAAATQPDSPATPGASAGAQGAVAVDVQTPGNADEPAGVRATEVTPPTTGPPPVGNTSTTLPPLQPPPLPPVTAPPTAVPKPPVVEVPCIPVAPLTTC